VSIRFFIIVLLMIFSSAIPPTLAADNPANTAQKSQQLILVGGATGRTGYRIVLLLQEQGYRVRGMTRDRERAAAAYGDSIEWVEADIRNPDSLISAFDGVDRFINATGTESRGADNTPEQVNYLGMKNLVDAAKQANIAYFSLISSGGVTDAAAHIRKNQNDSATWTFKGEEYLRASGLAYTIVRAAGMRDYPGGENGVLMLQQEDTPDALVSRSDVAHVMMECLFNDNASGKTFYIANYLALDPESWREAIAELKVD
jgi:uncharacterized protein YbjT (DUF2867 family)